MIIKKLPIGKVRAAAYNPRVEAVPGSDAYERIKKSIQEFSLVEPLVWNETTGNLVGGHQRLRVMKDMGFKVVEVSVVRITDAGKERALNLALNKVQGEWDFLKLQKVFLGFGSNLEGLAASGFTDMEIKDALAWQPLATNVEGIDKTPQEKLAAFQAGTIRQIVLLYSAKEHAEVLKRLAAVIKSEKLEDDNSVAVLHLLKFYENAGKKKGRAR